MVTISNLPNLSKFQGVIVTMRSGTVLRGLYVYHGIYVYVIWCGIGLIRVQPLGTRLIRVFIISGEASPIFGHANANFSVFIDRIRNQFLKK